MSWVSASSASACRPRNRLDGLAPFSHGDDALGDVLAEVADPLEIGRNADRADDLAQIGRQRLTPGDDRAIGLLVDLALRLVEHGVVGNDLAAPGHVGIDQGGDRLVDHALGVAAHGGDLAGEIFQLVVDRR